MKHSLKISLLTIFPGIFENFLKESLIGKSIDKKLLEVETINIRDFSEPPHFRVDDTPYGGGPGMLMRAEPICRAIEDVKKRLPQSKVILLSASGSRFDQRKAKELSNASELVFICGRYEGIDQRAIDLCVDEEISLGDFVLLGGEVAAMVLMEAVVRLRPGVLGNEDSSVTESFSLSSGANLLLEAPQYTKPAVIRGHSVPEVLLSGNHEAISKWRSEQSKLRTLKMRPDLIRN